MVRSGVLSVTRTTALTVDNFVRPSEIHTFQLTKCGLSALGHPGDSLGTWTDVKRTISTRASLLDLRTKPWISTMAVIFERPSKNTRLSQTSVTKNGRKTWKESAQILGRPSDNLHVLSHTVAPDDWLRKTRSLPEIRKRGRWRSDTSVKRHGKSDRTMAVMET